MDVTTKQADPKANVSRGKGGFGMLRSATCSGSGGTPAPIKLQRQRSATIGGSGGAGDDAPHKRICMKCGKALGENGHPLTSAQCKDGMFNVNDDELANNNTTKRRRQQSPQSAAKSSQKNAVGYYIVYFFHIYNDRYCLK